MREDFYRRLDHMMDIAARSLRIKGKLSPSCLITGFIHIPNSTWAPLPNHFSTIGLLGMNEAGLNARWLRKDMTHEETQTFTKDVLNHMRERLADYQELYGDLYNLEATLATSYRLAKHDRKRYPDIITAGEPGETPYYTNSSHLPVGYTTDIFDALDVQMKSRLSIPPERYSMHSSEKSCPTEIGIQAGGGRLPRITNFRTIHCRRPTLICLRITAYLKGAFYLSCLRQKGVEAYTDFTAYNRPVQNWNEGKHRNNQRQKVLRYHTLRSQNGTTFVLEPEKAQTGLRAGAKEGILPLSTKPVPIAAWLRNF